MKVETENTTIFNNHVNKNIPHMSNYTNIPHGVNLGEIKLRIEEIISRGNKSKKLNVGDAL